MDSMIRTNTVIRSLFLFIMMCVSVPAVWADVQASLDRSTIHAGDTVTLTIEATDNDRDGKPDLSVLKKDFDILGATSSRQIQIINGQHSERRQWRVELDPKSTGSLNIPAIAVGSLHTQALELLVTEQPVTASTDTNEPVFFQTEIEPATHSPYVQQQVHYTLRMYYRLPLVEGSIDEPQSDNAIIERLGEDQRYQTTVDEQDYQVLERRYAVFPQKSGKLILSPVSFDGRVMSTSTNRSFQGHMDSLMGRFLGGGNPFGESGKRVRVRSQPVTLDVQPIPADFSGVHWLPSENLTLKDDWEPSPPKFRVGEPVTRTITLRAKGLEASQLPELEIPDSASLPQYPEQPVDENHTDGDWVFGSRRQAFAFVPSQTGPASLPEIRIDWWDTDAQQTRTAILPAQEISVLPSSANASASTAPKVIEPTQSEEPNDNTATTEDNSNPDDQISRINFWWWLAVSGGAIILMAIIMLAYRNRRRKLRGFAHTNAGITLAPPSKRINTARRTLRSACENNDPQTAAPALLDWAACEWPQDAPRNLGTLALRLGSGMDVVHELDQALYAADHNTWNGANLWNTFKKGFPKSANDQTSKDQGLAPLYPHWHIKQH